MPPSHAEKQRLHSCIGCFRDREVNRSLYPDKYPKFASLPKRHQPQEMVSACSLRVQCKEACFLIPHNKLIAMQNNEENGLVSYIGLCKWVSRCQRIAHTAAEEKMTQASAAGIAKKNRLVIRAWTHNCDSTGYPICMTYAKN